MMDNEVVKKWMPVDLYIGGAQHAIMHLLYSRFIHKFLVDNRKSEPFMELVTQGIVQALVYEVQGIGRISEKEYEQRKQELQGLEMTSSFQKQSKSKNTGINPLEIVQSSSVDILRLALSFAAPPQSTLRFQNQLLSTMRSWLFKVNNTLFDLSKRNFQGAQISCEDALSKIAQIVKDYHHHLHKSRHLHVAVAKLMELRTLLQKNKEKINAKHSLHCSQLLLAGIYPFAPHFAAHLWKKLPKKKRSYQMIKDFRWESMQLKVLKKWREFGQKIITMSIQVNGKFLGIIKLEREKLESDAEEVIKEKIKAEGIKGSQRIENAKKVVILKQKGVVNFLI